MRRVLSRSVRRYRGWPVWGQVGLALVVVVLLAGAVGGDEATGGATPTGDRDGPVEDRLPRAPTTTSVERTPTTAESRTTTTAAATTTGAPASTTAPTTAASAATAGPPTTRATTTTTVPTTSPPAPAPTAAPDGCHPSYQGACLPPDASDVDCEGGSGNGPVYTGTVRVVGPDDYELDRDGDGVACER